MRDQIVRRGWMLLCLLFVGAPSLLWAQSSVVATDVIGPSAEEAGTTDPYPSPRFGQTVAISGRVAMASIPGDLVDDDNEYGRVAVFEQTKNGWERTATLLGSEESGGAFGRGIDIQGHKAVIAATKAIYLYEKRGRAWVETAKAVLGANATVGSNVELEHGLIFVRIYEAPEGLPVKSVVNVYAKSAAYGKGAQNARHGVHPTAALNRIATIKPQDGSVSTSFGSSVAMQGNTLVVGAPEQEEPGSVYVYVRFGHHWWQVDRLVASDGTVGDGFGSAVAVRNGVIVVGAPNADLRREDDEGYGPPRGNVYVYLPSRRGWYESQQLNDPSNDYVIRDLGHDVSMGRGLLAVLVPDRRGILRGEDRVLVYDWVNRSFQFPQTVASYEGRLPDIDMSGRRLIVSTNENEFYYGYVRGRATIFQFNRGSSSSPPDTCVDP